MSKVRKLFIKKEAKAPMNDVESISVENGVIVSQKKFQDLRSVLITSDELIKIHNIKPGDLRENIFIEDFDIFTLESGDVLRVGEVDIQITFYCEPCKNMSHIGDIKTLDGKRGVLGVFLNDGVVNVGDKVEIIAKNKYENIPYAWQDRIAWYLETKVKDKITASELLTKCGVFPSLIRVLPQTLEKHNMKNKEKVVFVTHERC